MEAVWGKACSSSTSRWINPQSYQDTLTSMASSGQGGVERVAPGSGSKREEREELMELQVLIVEDDEFQQETLTAIIESAARALHNVRPVITVAPTGAGALERCKHEGDRKAILHLVFLDLLLPGGFHGDQVYLASPPLSPCALRRSAPPQPLPPTPAVLARAARQPGRACGGRDALEQDVGAHAPRVPRHGRRRLPH